MESEESAGRPAAILNGLPLMWSDLATRWQALPAATRRILVQKAAGCLRDAWRRGVILERIPVAYLAFSESPAGWSASLPAPLIRFASAPQPIKSVLDCLARWHEETRAVLHPTESMRFLHTFTQGESLWTADRTTLARALQREAHQVALQRAAEAYRSALALDDRRRGSVRGIWSPMPDLHPMALLKAVQAAEAAPESAPMKIDRRSCVLRATVLGLDVLLKRYDADGWHDRMRGMIRPSKGRRAWAAAQTLQTLRLPTPRPLGFVEVFDKGRVITSYVMTSFVHESESAFRWLRRTYPKLPDSDKARVRETLATLLGSLYDRGIYHADTKLSNILVGDGDDAATRRFLWVDLESVSAGRTLTRGRVLRNLVQLNGSVRSWMPEEDRLAFLRLLAPRFPWVLEPGVARGIRDRSVRRLRNELEGRTPPDGRPTPQHR